MFGRQAKYVTVALSRTLSKNKTRDFLSLCFQLQPLSAHLRLLRLAPSPPISVSVEKKFFCQNLNPLLVFSNKKVN